MYPQALWEYILAFSSLCSKAGTLYKKDKNRILPHYIGIIYTTTHTYTNSTEKKVNKKFGKCMAKCSLKKKTVYEKILYNIII